MMCWVLDILGLSLLTTGAGMRRVELPLPYHKAHRAHMNKSHMPTRVGARDTTTLGCVIVSTGEVPSFTL